VLKRTAVRRRKIYKMQEAFLRPYQKEGKVNRQRRREKKGERAREN